jgi:hypothetical protein
MENGKWKHEMKMKENVFLGPQSLVFWKKNCSAQAVEPVDCSADLPHICAFCNFGAVQFCSSVLLFLFFLSLRSLMSVSQSLWTLASGKLTILSSFQ